MKRPALTLLLVTILFGAHTSLHAMNAAVRRSPRAAYAVRITQSALPSGSTSIDIGPNLWSLQGFDLRGLLAHVYGVDPARIDLHLPASESEPLRFDVSLALTGDETDATVQQILASALQTRFHLGASLERRSVEVYVLTAPHGAGTGLRVANASSAHVKPVSFELNKSAAVDPGDSASEEQDLAPETITVSGRVCPGISSAGIAARGATVNSLARALEEQLDRPVVDETHLGAAYDFEIPEYRSQQQLFALLHEKLGFEVTIARRELAILAIRPTAQLSPSADQTAQLQPLALVR